MTSICDRNFATSSAKERFFSSPAYKLTSRITPRSNTGGASALSWRYLHSLEWCVFQSFRWHVYRSTHILNGGVNLWTVMKNSTSRAFE
jgi:hypothetical protein